MTRLRRELAQLSRYGLAGIVSNGALYCVFLLLLRLGVTPIMGAGFCYILGVGASYFLNRRWTFSTSEGHWLGSLKYLGAYGVGFVTALASIKALTRWLPPEIAQIINIGVTALVIYSALRLFRFGGSAARVAR